MPHVRFMAKMSTLSFKFRRLIVACTILGSASLCVAREQDKRVKDSPLPEGYRIGAGDVLQVLVWKEPDASLPDAMVRTDGKISIPLVGDVEVAGLTPEQLKASLADKLS